MVKKSEDYYQGRLDALLQISDGKLGTNHGNTFIINKEILQQNIRYYLEKIVDE